jgi:hypothetical protein
MNSGVSNPKSGIEWLVHGPFGEHAHCKFGVLRAGNISYACVPYDLNRSNDGVNQC